MINLINPSTDPYFNLALEEYLLMSEDNQQDYFMLWQNRPVVVVGRNQNTLEEINREAVKDKGIAVVRRLSGGGAVYHDLGNLNFTFIVGDHKRVAFDFARFTEPIIKTLDKMGVKAENSGRNDITIEGRKFSGNAQYRWKHRLLHHGTLMFDCNIRDMVEVLNVSNEKIISKGVKSVRSRVTNISEHLKDPVTMEQLKEILIDTVRGDGFLQGDRRLSAEDIKAVEVLRQEKYTNWYWVYGNSPAYNVRRQAVFSWGTVDVRMFIENDLVVGCMIYGDFFSNGNINDFAGLLLGVPYRGEDIHNQLAGIDLNYYFPAAGSDEIEKLLYAEQNNER